MSSTAGGSLDYFVDDPTFSLLETARESRVKITWSDGTEGPTIAFASRQEAEVWIKRDARDWLVRVAAATVGRAGNR